MIGLLLSRWKVGLGLFGALAVFGLFAASWHYRNAYHAEKALRQADRASYALAQSQAEAKATADARAREQAHQAHTAKIEDERHDLQDRLAALADRYARNNRVRREAAQGAASVLPAAAEDHGPGVRTDTAEAAFVAVTRDDFDRCTVIAGDYVALREWALKLPN